jgi:hypothetical protein
MGRYYGLINHTKNHKVSSYWKNVPPSLKNIIQIATIFGWDREDAIFTGSYDIIYYYHIDKDGNVSCYLMEEPKNIEKENTHILEQELLEDVYEYNVINVDDYDDIEFIDSKYLKQKEFEDKCSKIPESISATLLSFNGNETLKQYGYNFNKMGSNFYRFPDWEITENGKVDNNTTYIFNNDKFKKYSKSSTFNDVFFFS